MKCPSCNFEYTYEDGEYLVCSACQFRWNQMNMLIQIKKIF